MLIAAIVVAYILVTLALCVAVGAVGACVALVERVQVLENEIIDVSNQAAMAHGYCLEVSQNTAR